MDNESDWRRRKTENFTIVGIVETFFVVHDENSFNK